MKLKEALEKKRFVVTSEIQPPVDEGPEEVIKRTKEASDFDSIRHDPRFQKLLSEGSDTSA